MSTLGVSRYLPASLGLFGYGAGPESQTLQRLTADVFTRLALHSSPQAAINDLYTLQNEALESGDELATETVEMAKRFLLAWPKTMPVPELALDTDGEIVFDWAAPGRRMVSVSLRADGRLSYAGQLGGRRTVHGTEALDDAVPEPIVEAVRSAFR
jgi:hypothetical protein